MNIQRIRGTIVVTGALFLIVAASYAEGNQEQAGHSGDYGTFTSLRVEIPAEVTLLQGETNRVQADIPRRWRDRLVIRNERGTLVIDERRNQLFSLTTDKPRFTITMPTMENLTLSGSAELRSEDRWEGEQIDISLSGSGRMRLAALSAERVEATVSGSGSLGIAEVEALQVRLRSSGSGELVAGRLRCEEVDLRSSGSGDINLAVETGVLDASSSGSADLSLRGRVETLRLGTSGSGTVRGEELFAASAEIRMSGSGDVTLQEGSGVTTVRSSGSGNFSLR